MTLPRTLGLGPASTFTAESLVVETWCRLGPFWGTLALGDLCIPGLSNLRLLGLTSQTLTDVTVWY